MKHSTAISIDIIITAIVLIYISVMGFMVITHIDNKQIHKNCHDYTYKVSNTIGVLDIGLNDKVICTGNTQIDRYDALNKQTIYFWLEYENPNDMYPMPKVHECLITTKRCE